LAYINAAQSISFTAESQGGGGGGNYTVSAKVSIFKVAQI